MSGLPAPRSATRGPTIRARRHPALLLQRRWSGHEEEIDMATAPRRMASDPDATPTIAPESQDKEMLTREAAADRGVDPTPGAPEEGWTHEHPSAERIAAEAYAIYLAGGQRDGNDLEDWLEA